MHLAASAAEADLAEHPAVCHSSTNKRIKPEGAQMSDVVDQVVEVVQSLERLTRIDQVRWRKTDDPYSFVLVRPHGTVAIGPSGGGDQGWPFLYIRFLESDATPTYEFQESPLPSALDNPLHDLWDTVVDKTSEVKQTMSKWLSDLRSIDEPF